MATTNALNNTLAGQTGTGDVVGSTSPTLTTPNIGAANGTSIQLLSSAGIVGVTDGTNASAGFVGEFTNTAVIGPVNYPASTGIVNAQQLNLSAGNWMVFFQTLQLLPAGISAALGRLSTVSLDPTTTGTGLGQFYSNTPSVLSFTGQNIYTFAAPTTVYLVMTATYSGATPSYFSQMGATRIR